MITPSSPNPVSANPLTASPTPASKIRNIVQSAQEREIVKTAPDMVVY